jgi:hypothetical protein
MWGYGRSLTSFIPMLNLPTHCPIINDIELTYTGGWLKLSGVNPLNILVTVTLCPLLSADSPQAMQ